MRKIAKKIRKLCEKERNEDWKIKIYNTYKWGRRTYKKKITERKIEYLKNIIEEEADPWGTAFKMSKYRKSGGILETLETNNIWTQNFEETIDASVKNIL